MTDNRTSRCCRGCYHYGHFVGYKGEICELHDSSDVHESFSPSADEPERWIMGGRRNGKELETLFMEPPDFAKTSQNDERDTREKLEADANGYVMSWWQSDWVDSFTHADSMKRDIMRLLDRQDAITANELTSESDAPKPTESGEIDTSKDDMRDFDDSREKLEKDLKTHLYEFGGYCFSSREGHTDNVDTFFDDFVFLLDRQAVITHSIDAWNIERLEKRIAEQDRAIVEYAEKNAELQAKVDEMTERLESAHAKNRSLRAHIAKMQEGRHGWHVKYPELLKRSAELKARVDELERENARLSSDELHWRNQASQVDAIREARLDKLLSQRDELQAAYDAMVGKCAELCALAGFSMVDASGEVVS